MRILCILFVLGVIMIPFHLFSTSLIYFTDEMLVKQADRIAVGTIVESWSEWNPQMEILVTYATMEIEYQLKGVGDVKTVTLRAMGGRDGEFEYVVPSAPKLDKIGDKFFVFIYDDVEKYESNLVGWMQGFLSIDKDNMVVPKNVSLENYVEKIEKLVKQTSKTK